MALLGINISGFHSSTCLLVDGKIVAAITEERLSRVKRDKSFPKLAIDYCCKIARIEINEISDIYIGWNPTYYISKSDNSIYDALQNRGKLSYLALNEMSTMVPDELQSVTHEIKGINTNWKLHFVNHHHAHLSNSFLSSKFEESDFFIADGFGEHTTGILGKVDYNGIESFEDLRTPHSLGSFYSTFTEFLGFHPNGDEWKVMALASLGDPKKYYEKVRRLIRIDGFRFELDLSYFEHFLFFTEHYYSPKFISEFGDPISGDNLNQDHYDLVAAVQQVAEDVSVELIKNLHDHTGGENLVVAGGFFMNSVLNGKILEKTPYKSVYIGGSPDDSGISLGSALYGHVYDKGNKTQLQEQLDNYYGAEFSEEDITKELTKRKIKFQKSKNITSEVAELIREGNIIGWFQGRSEFGQRALGNRSILADPTFEDVKDKVNSSIKYREGFRPFAPSVLEEAQHDYFEIPKNQTSYFMEKVFMFKDEHKEKLPGVVHFDGSGRIQTVSKEINSKYHELIKNFGKLSGIPILLNTSFNINGMPLVESPGDAIDCFYKSGIDYLVMGDIIVTK